MKVGFELNAFNFHLSPAAERRHQQAEDFSSLIEQHARKVMVPGSLQDDDEPDDNTVETDATMDSNDRSGMESAEKLMIEMRAAGDGGMQGEGGQSAAQGQADGSAAAEAMKNQTHMAEELEYKNKLQAAT
ncbi:hypothetical protein [Rhizobium sp. L1K21]|uniref:hypothetical protein n=1 Tax=Rhizobium sp. L1K21 TaxID=2954933 RepID=UPI00209323BE|nr:hypothetical protein [Rhizobium sp. L1K21]MCO6186327.1 hypothetical protein [Rhizobium sp. L1K21]